MEYVYSDEDGKGKWLFRSQKGGICVVFFYKKGGTTTKFKHPKLDTRISVRSFVCHAHGTPPEI